MSKICLQNVSLEYEEDNSRFCAIKDISMSINEGEFVSIIGRAGAAKARF